MILPTAGKWSNSAPIGYLSQPEKKKKTSYTHSVGDDY
jgi:hypothetical protein